MSADRGKRENAGKHSKYAKESDQLQIVTPAPKKGKQDAGEEDDTNRSGSDDKAPEKKKRAAKKTTVGLWLVHTTTGQNAADICQVRDPCQINVSLSITIDALKVCPALDSEFPDARSYQKTSILVLNYHGTRIPAQLTVQAALAASGNSYDQPWVVCLSRSASPRSILLGAGQVARTVAPGMGTNLASELGQGTNSTTPSTTNTTTHANNSSYATTGTVNNTSSALPATPITVNTSTSTSTTNPVIAPPTTTSTTTAAAPALKRRTSDLFAEAVQSSALSATAAPFLPGSSAKRQRAAKASSASTLQGSASTTAAAGTSSNSGGCLDCGTVIPASQQLSFCAVCKKMKRCGQQSVSTSCHFCYDVTFHGRFFFFFSTFTGHCEPHGEQPGRGNGTHIQVLFLCCWVRDQRRLCRPK